MATKLQVVGATLGPTSAQLQSAVDTYFEEHPIDYSLAKKLWPTFTGTGEFVECRPKEGIPIHVVTGIEATSVPYTSLTLSVYRDYEASDYYTQYTVEFGEPVYGGTMDWDTGVLTVTWTFDEENHKGIKLDNPYTIQYPAQKILPFPGINVIGAEDAVGNSTITCVIDPNETLEELKNAILALGGNV